VLHEAVHWNQWQAAKFTFYPRYVWYMWKYRKDYRENPYELQARMISGVW